MITFVIPRVAGYLSDGVIKSVLSPNRYGAGTPFTGRVNWATL
jgi:hypothetical protein